MTTKTLTRWGAAVIVSTALSSPAFAAMGNTASTYGLLPADVGTAQGMSLFNTQASALYYNPSYLTQDPRGELTTGLLHGEQELRVESQGNPSGGPGRVTRDGDVLNDTPSQQVVLALKTDLGDITKFDFPIYFAMIAGVEKYNDEMLAFTSETSQEGQFLNYERQPLFLNLGGGMELANGIYTGVSAHISLKSDAVLVADLRTDGETSNESLNVSAKPVLRPVVGTTFDWSRVFCGKAECGILTGLETAVVFRGHTEARTSVESQANIPGLTTESIQILVDTVDSYQPDIWSAGFLYNFTDNVRVALSAEHQAWSDLEEKLQRDSIKDDANAEFKDIVVPRVGAEWQINKNLMVMGGAAFQESPLESTRTPDVNYFDSDKIIVGVGASLTIHEPPILAYPMRLDFGYQFQQLEERDFELTTADAPNNPYELVTTDGDVHVFSGSVTLKF